MSRKSKGKFTLKGHALPGIKQKVGGSLLDGRAKSSAFQMKNSPFQKEDDDKTKLEFSDIEAPDQDANKAKSQAEGQTGVNYGLQELISMRNRLKAKKKKEEKPSEVLDEKTTEYDENLKLDPRGLNAEDAVIYEADPNELSSTDLQRYRELHGHDPNYDFLQDESIIKGDIDDSGEVYKGPSVETTDDYSNIEESPEIQKMDETAFSEIIKTGGKLSDKNWDLMSLFQQEEYIKAHPGVFPGLS